MIEAQTECQKAGAAASAIALAAAEWSAYETLQARAQQARTCAAAEAAQAAYTNYRKAFDRAVSAIRRAPDSFDASDFICAGPRAQLSF